MSGENPCSLSEKKHTFWRNGHKQRVVLDLRQCRKDRRDVRSEGGWIISMETTEIDGSAYYLKVERVCYRLGHWRKCERKTYILKIESQVQNTSQIERQHTSWKGYTRRDQVRMRTLTPLEGTAYELTGKTSVIQWDRGRIWKEEYHIQPPANGGTESVNWWK